MGVSSCTTDLRRIPERPQDTCENSNSRDRLASLDARLRRKAREPTRILNENSHRTPLRTRASSKSTFATTHSYVFLLFFFFFFKEEKKKRRSLAGSARPSAAPGNLILKIYVYILFLLLTSIDVCVLSVCAKLEYGKVSLVDGYPRSLRDLAATKEWLVLAPMSC